MRQHARSRPIPEIACTLAHGVLALALLRCEAHRDVVAIDAASTAPPLDTSGSGGAGASNTNAGRGGGGAMAAGAGEPFGGRAQAGSGGEPRSDGGTVGSGGNVGGSAGSSMDRGCLTGPPRVPLTELGGRARSVCSAALARDRMSYALCACVDLDVLGLVNTDGFDSREPASTITSGASIGINGSYVRDNYTSIDGSLTVTGSTALSFAGLDVTGDVRLAAETSAAGPLRVGRDAWFARSVSVLVSAEIGRDLHLAPGSSVTGSFVQGVGGDTIEAPFTLDEPCRCGPDAEFDLEAAVADARDRNDNAMIGLAPLPSVPAKGLDLELPCGRFFLTHLETAHDVRILVTGRAALFVADDFETGDLTIELAPDAELDWFVQGDLTLSFAERVGDPNRAAALRIYTTSASHIAFSPSHVAANLHAPRADVTLTGIGDLYGSVLARTIHAVGAVGVHYDRAVLEAGNGCGESDVTACEGCGACARGLACIAGACTSCTTDADCCSPFICNLGACEPLLSSKPP